jgi:hypothetical protein
MIHKDIALVISYPEFDKMDVEELRKKAARESGCPMFDKVDHGECSNPAAFGI